MGKWKGDGFILKQTVKCGLLAYKEQDRRYRGIRKVEVSIKEQNKNNEKRDRRKGKDEQIDWGYGITADNAYKKR